MRNLSESIEQAEKMLRFGQYHMMFSCDFHLFRVEKKYLDQVREDYVRFIQEQADKHMIADNIVEPETLSYHHTQQFDPEYNQASDDGLYNADIKSDAESIQLDDGIENDQDTSQELPSTINEVGQNNQINDDNDLNQLDDVPEIPDNTGNSTESSVELPSDLPTKETVDRTAEIESLSRPFFGTFNTPLNNPHMPFATPFSAIASSSPVLPFRSLFSANNESQEIKEIENFVKEDVSLFAKESSDEILNLSKSRLKRNSFMISDSENEDIQS
jgi:hypothetical protein